MIKPGNWIATRFTAAQRREIATWLLIVFIITTPLRYIFKDQVWMVWFLSEVALDLALLGVIAAETPVENQ